MENSLHCGRTSQEMEAAELSQSLCSFGFPRTPTLQGLRIRNSRDNSWNFSSFWYYSLKASDELSESHSESMSSLHSKQESCASSAASLTIQLSFFFIAMRVAHSQTSYDEHSFTTMTKKWNSSKVQRSQQATSKVVNATLISSNEAFVIIFMLKSPLQVLSPYLVQN